MFQLTVYLRERLLGRSSFEDDEVRIGRNPDNEVQIDNLALSRYHASIEVVAGLHVLKDFGSQNGTFVNGERLVGRRALNDGDQIGLGKFTLVFNGDKQPAEADAVPIRDKAAYAVAGETLVGQTASQFQRPCPFAGFLERVGDLADKPEVHPLDRDLCIVGTASDADVRLAEGTSPDRAAAITRTWSGFKLVSLDARTMRNGDPVRVRTDLLSGDELAFGNAKFRFRLNNIEARP